MTPELHICCCQAPFSTFCDALILHVQAKRAQLALAFGKQWTPPVAPPDHRTHLCQEAAWLAVDFAQVGVSRWGPARIALSTPKMCTFTI